MSKSKSLQEQIKRMNRISKLNEGYSMEEVRAEENKMYEQEDDADINTNETQSSEEDPFADDMDIDVNDEELESGDNEDTEEDEVVELDVTDIVNKSEQALSAIQDTNISIDNISTKLDNVYSVVGNLNQLTDEMNKFITNIARDIDLMKPPTQEEKKEALSKTSYPYSVKIDDYAKGKAMETQTDLENKARNLTLDDVISGFNERDIKNSFTQDDEDDEKLKRLNNRLANYRI